MTPGSLGASTRSRTVKDRRSRSHQRRPSRAPLRPRTGQLGGENDGSVQLRSAPRCWTPYRREIELADAIIAATSLDSAQAWWPEDLFGSWRLDNLREILLHVIAVPLSDETVDHDRPQDASDGPEHVAG